jgi:DNA invertase Pin-like site-specific DNA recombinase
MNATRVRRAAIYSRVSTTSQNTKNQVRELRQVAERHGWQVVTEFTDDGISGAKGRDRRPGLEARMQAVARREPVSSAVTDMLKLRLQPWTA